jgi:AraC-like DNA-binding protein
MTRTHIYAWDRLVLSLGPGRENSSHRHFGAIVVLTPDAPMTLNSRGHAPVIARAAVIAPNAWHHTDARNCRTATILVGPDHPWFRYVKPLLDGGGTIMPLPDDAAANALATLHWDALFEGRCSCVEARQQAQHILELFGGKDAAPHRLDARIEEVLEVLGQAGAETPTLSDLGRRVGLSGFTLMRRFKAELGVRMREYVLWRRIMAGLAMVDGRSTIADIAQRTGFYDQAHLTRTVRRMVELAPSFFNDFNQTQVHVCNDCD